MPGGPRARSSPWRGFRGARPAPPCPCRLQCRPGRGGLLLPAARGAALEDGLPRAFGCAAPGGRPCAGGGGPVRAAGSGSAPGRVAGAARTAPGGSVQLRQASGGHGVPSALAVRVGCDRSCVAGTRAAGGLRHASPRQKRQAAPRSCAEAAGLRCADPGHQRGGLGRRPGNRAPLRTHTSLWFRAQGDVGGAGRWGSRTAAPFRRVRLVLQAPGTPIIARQVTPTTIIKQVSQAQTTAQPAAALQRSPGVQVRRGPRPRGTGPRAGRGAGAGFRVVLWRLARAASGPLSVTPRGAAHRVAGWCVAGGHLRSRDSVCGSSCVRPAPVNALAVAALSRALSRAPPGVVARRQLGPWFPEPRRRVAGRPPCPSGGVWPRQPGRMEQPGEWLEQRAEGLWSVHWVWPGSAWARGALGRVAGLHVISTTPFWTRGPRPECGRGVRSTLHRLFAPGRVLRARCPQRVLASLRREGVPRPRVPGFSLESSVMGASAIGCSERRFRKAVMRISPAPAPVQSASVSDAGTGPVCRKPRVGTPAAGARAAPRVLWCLPAAGLTRAGFPSRGRETGGEGGPSARSPEASPKPGSAAWSPRAPARVLSGWVPGAPRPAPGPRCPCFRR